MAKGEAAREVKAIIKAKEKEDEKKEEPVVEQPVEAKPEVKKVEEKPKEETKETPKKEVPKKEEPKKTDKKEDKKPEEPFEEKVLTLPLRDAWRSPRTTRTRAVVRVLKAQLKKHTRRDVKLDMSVNNVLWAKGIRNPPRRIKVRVRISKSEAKAFAVK